VMWHREKRGGGLVVGMRLPQLNEGGAKGIEGEAGSGDAASKRRGWAAEPGGCQT